MVAWRAWTAWVLTACASFGAAGPIHANGVGPQGRFDFATAPGRLSKAVVPSAYALHLDLDPARPDFAGEVAIDLKLHAAQPAIVLHAATLRARHAELRDGAGRVTPLKVEADEAAQLWRLVPAAGEVAAGDYRLVLRYAGTVQKVGAGLYRTAEKDAPMLATQLEAVHARYVFPCFDEPAFRASFVISVSAPKALQVVSNMPEQAAQPEGAKRRHRFAPTPSMPTYLVAVAVGRFDVLEGKAAGVPLRILTAPGKREQGRFALRATGQLLAYYRDYFGVPYLLPKLDQLAVPSVRQGAMEDWGLISYSEPALLVDPKRGGPTAERRVYSVVAHEIAHQWFGNLVTASSWDEIWLNEAFATWMANKATEHFNPSWNVALNERAKLDHVLGRDAGNATRAIRSGPVRESAVFDVFDSITYRKGGAVLSMIEAWLGPDVFQRGLAAYMAERRLSNATADDLWHHLSQASGFDVTAVARSWTDQTGYPLVQVDASCERGHTEVVLRQQRFFIRAAGIDAPASGTLWSIPVRVARGADERTLMLDAPEQTFRLDGCSAAPLVVNAGGDGYYRTQYAPVNARAIERRFEQLPAADRITLASDALALGRAGRVPLQGWFELVARLPRVEGPGRSSLALQALDALDDIDRSFEGLSAQEAVRRFGLRVFAPELARLGWAARPGESEDDRLLRGALIKQLAAFGDAEVLAQAGTLYDAERRQPIDASLREAVVIAAGRGADRARFDRLRAELLACRSTTERHGLAAALASGQDAGRVQELLRLTVAPRLPTDVALSLPAYVAELSPFGAQAYRFTLDHWPQLSARSGSSVFGGIQGLLPEAADGFHERAEAARLVADQQRLVGDDGAAKAREVAERIERRAALREREAAPLAKELEALMPR